MKVKQKSLRKFLAMRKKIAKKIESEKLDLSKVVSEIAFLESGVFRVAGRPVVANATNDIPKRKPGRPKGSTKKNKEALLKIKNPLSDVILDIVTRNKTDLPGIVQAVYLSGFKYAKGDITPAVLRTLQDLVVHNQIVRNDEDMKYQIKAI